jgi:lipopolysaccharide heptosyltransferase I
MSDCNDRPRRFLIARMSAIGDTILTLPVACALREAYPDAYLAWVVERKSAAMVLNHPCLDDVFTLERGWFVSRRQRRAVRHQLRACRFDVSIDCQSVTKSALACWLSGAPMRIGCRGKYGAEFSPLLNNHLLEPTTSHLTDRSLELLRPLGIATPRVKWQLFVEKKAETVASVLRSAVGRTNSFAIINPGATWKSKLWEMSRFAAVARHLGETHALKTLVVWGNPQELVAAKEIAAAASPHAVVAPQTSLQELAAVIRGGRLFVSSDTGPLHMAVAVGTPSIGLYGPTRPEDCGPYGNPHRALQMRYQEGSRRARRNADNSAMREISAERVCAACDQLLSETAQRAA